MFVAWCLIVGVLLVVIGLTDTVRQQLPFSASLVYLTAGYLLGPEVSGMLTLTLDDDAQLVERLTEAAVLVSLFAVGLRLRTPLRDPLWHTPFVLATLAMVVTIALVALVGLAIGLTLGAAVLLGAVLAPTDPVLASDVQVQHARDRDHLRFSLTGEGGLNDGSAFPFVMLGLGLLGLHELGPYGVRWWGVDVLWAATAGIAAGFGLGFVFSRAVVWLRREREQALGMESFLTLGLIALAYGLALAIHAYGFLAVFAAGLAMRDVERRDNAQAEAEDDAAVEEAVLHAQPQHASDERKASAYMAKAALDFTLDLERLAEFTVMLIIGSLLTRAAFTLTSLGVAAALLFVVRPVAILLTTWRLPLSPGQRRLAAWFGVRGIGSMYYLAYVVAHGAGAAVQPLVADAVLVTIVLSVLLHGATATPVMRLYHRARGRHA